MLPFRSSSRSLCSYSRRVLPALLGYFYSVTSVCASYRVAVDYLRFVMYAGLYSGFHPVVFIQTCYSLGYLDSSIAILGSWCVTWKLDANKLLIFFSEMSLLSFNHLLNLSFAWHTHRNTGEVLKILDRGAAINNALQVRASLYSIILA
jgi:hypothetical protein